jgi:hypothetical protein
MVKKEEDEKLYSAVALGLSIGGWVLPFVGIALFIAGLVMGLKQRKKNRDDPMALAAVIISIIGIIFSVIIMIVFAIFFSAIFLYTSSYDDGSGMSVSRDISTNNPVRTFNDKIEFVELKNGSLTIQNFESEEVVLDKVSVESCKDVYNYTLMPNSINEIDLVGCDLEKGLMGTTTIEIGTSTLESYQMVH